MICDMCGSPGKMYKAVIESAEMTVCQECSRFGKVTGIVKQEIYTGIKASPAGKQEPETEKINVIVRDYADNIRKGRERLGMSQEEFAKKINEKESLVQKMESGHFEPSMDLAKKIGRFLKITLVEEYEESHEKQSRPKSDTLTIGDIIKLKGK